MESLEQQSDYTDYVLLFITFHFIVNSSTFAHVGIQSVRMMTLFFQWADWSVVELLAVYDLLFWS